MVCAVQADPSLYNARAVHPDGQPTTISDPVAMFERIYKQGIIMSANMLEQGVSNMGDTTNLRRAFLKLVTGTPSALPPFRLSFALGPCWRYMHYFETFKLPCILVVSLCT